MRVACDAALADLLEYMSEDGVRVAALDATNSTKERRKHITTTLKKDWLDLACFRNLWGDNLVDVDYPTLCMYGSHALPNDFSMTEAWKERKREGITMISICLAPRPCRVRLVGVGSSSRGLKRC